MPLEREKQIPPGMTKFWRSCMRVERLDAVFSQRAIHHGGHRETYERTKTQESICVGGPPQKSRKAVPTQAREESDRISTNGRNANYTEGCDEKPDYLRANGWDGVAGRVRQIEYQFRAKRYGASGHALEPDSAAATISGANAGDTGCCARAGASAGSNAAAG